MRLLIIPSLKFLIWKEMELGKLVVIALYIYSFCLQPVFYFALELSLPCLPLPPFSAHPPSTQLPMEPGTLAGGYQMSGVFRSRHTKGYC